MASTNLTTHRNRTLIKELETKLEVAEMLISVLAWAKPTPQQLLTRSQRLRLSDVSRRAGLDHQAMVRRGVDLFLKQEAPVYLA